MRKQEIVSRARCDALLIANAQGFSAGRVKRPAIRGCYSSVFSRTGLAQRIGVSWAYLGHKFFLRAKHQGQYGFEGSVFTLFRREAVPGANPADSLPCTKVTIVTIISLKQDCSTCCGWSRGRGIRPRSGAAGEKSNQIKPLFYFFRNDAERLTESGDEAEFANPPFHRFVSALVFPLFSANHAECFY
jgi:hypothetical protein